MGCNWRRGRIGYHTQPLSGLSRPHTQRAGYLSGTCGSGPDYPTRSAGHLEHAAPPRPAPWRRRSRPAGAHQEAGRMAARLFPVAQEINVPTGRAAAPDGSWPCAMSAEIARLAETSQALMIPLSLPRATIRLPGARRSSRSGPQCPFRRRVAVDDMSVAGSDPAGAGATSFSCCACRRRRGCCRTATPCRGTAASSTGRRGSR